MGRIGRIVVVVVVLAFLIGPVLLVIPLSFNSTRYLSFPPESYSWRWYETFLGDRQWTASIWRSLSVATLAALISTVLGVGAALGLVRGRGRVGTLIRVGVLVPLVVPVIVLAAAQFGVFARFGLIGSMVGLAAAHALLGLPFVVFVVAAGLTRVEQRLEQAAWTLGASRWQAFYQITLPLLLPAVVAGTLFAFIISFDEVVIAIFLSGTVTPTLPVKFFSQLSSEVTPVIAAASTLLVMLFGAGWIALAAARSLGRTRRFGGGA